ncbi:hypothetical protein [Nocardia sp. NPDC050710]|uniref:hypothetical protein n=1 Tax=Nocardia sp. NPDC050710 TaxID=3157220 RepID=UPI003401F5DF
MFESCHTPHDAAHLLRHRYGLPVELAALRPTVTCGSHISAVDMPAQLGYRVLDLLDERHPAPAVANPRDTAWTFLVAPPQPSTLLKPEQIRRFADHRVAVRSIGQRVMLPVSDRGHGWRWASEPRRGTLRLPPRTAVLDAVERLIDGGEPSC